MAMRLQVAGQGGTRAQTTPAVVVAGKTCVKGPVGHCLVPVGAWQPPKSPLERVTAGQLGGHMVASMAPLMTGVGTGARVREVTGIFDILRGEKPKEPKELTDKELEELKRLKALREAKEAEKATEGEGE